MQGVQEFFPGQTASLSQVKTLSWSVFCLFQRQNVSVKKVHLLSVVSTCTFTPQCRKCAWTAPWCSMSLWADRLHWHDAVNIPALRDCASMKCWRHSIMSMQSVRSLWHRASRCYSDTSVFVQHGATGLHWLAPSDFVWSLCLVLFIEWPLQDIIRISHHLQDRALPCILLYIYIFSFWVMTFSDLHHLCPNMVFHRTRTCANAPNTCVLP